VIASSFDYLLEVRTADIRRYREVLGEHIPALPCRQHLDRRRYASGQ
jgi:hypothetical protein